jgi:hypothetical protein
MAGRGLPVTTGDALVLLGLVLIYLEFIKAARRRKPVTDHLLSLLLFGGMAFELAAVPKAATTTFLILLALSFIELLVGFSVSAPRAVRSETAGHAAGTIDEPMDEAMEPPPGDPRLARQEPPLA